MRVLILTGRAFPYIGGIEVFMREVVGGLSQHAEVSVVAERVDATSHRWDGLLRQPSRFDSFSDRGAAYRQLQLPIVRRSALLPLACTQLPLLARYARRPRVRRASVAYYRHAMRGHLKGCVDSADVVHLWGAGASGYLAAAAVDAANRTSTPIAITPFAHPGQWGEDPGYEWSYRHADRVIGLLAADLEVYENLGVPRSRLREIGVCSPGVSPISKNDARRTLGVSGPLVVFLGARRPYKGYDLLIEATHSLEEAIPDLRVAIVGPGAPLARSASNVLDVGEVSESERGMWLAAADVMCLPSAGEIFPVSILEAWSARTAVLTSNLPPLVELAKRSGGAVCTERSVEGIGTALRSLFSSPGRIEALAEAGFKYWRRGHTVDAVVDRHVDLYKELIASA